MRVQTLAFLPLIAGTAASLNPHQPRQTSSPSASVCLASLESIASSFPPIPRDLIGLTDINPITDACNYTPPVTMASAFSSYSSAVSSWVGENWPKALSVVEKCPDVKSEVEGAQKAWDFLLCTTGTTGGGGGGNGVGVTATTTTTKATGTSAVTTGTNGANASGSGGVQSTTKSGAGARETGFVGGVIAAVGIVGAIVAL